jgi:hypothetical protein
MILRIGAETLGFAGLFPSYPSSYPYFEALTVAVDKMIEFQTNIVDWWREKVTPGQSPGSNQWSNADLRSTISCPDAERLLGIRQQKIRAQGQTYAQSDAFLAEGYTSRKPLIQHQHFNVAAQLSF